MCNERNETKSYKHLQLLHKKLALHKPIAYLYTAKQDTNNLLPCSTQTYQVFED